MVSVLNRLAKTGAVAVTTVATLTLASPGVSGAAECGIGTIFDPATNTCFAAPPPPPPPPPPPVWNGDPTPGFSIGICAPIPYVALCTGI
jgi:hypothetical protein